MLYWETAALIDARNNFPVMRSAQYFAKGRSGGSGGYTPDCICTWAPFSREQFIRLTVSSRTPAAEIYPSGTPFSFLFFFFSCFHLVHTVPHFSLFVKADKTRPCVLWFPQYFTVNGWCDRKRQGENTIWLKAGKYVTQFLSTLPFFSLPNLAPGICSYASKIIHCQGATINGFLKCAMLPHRNVVRVKKEIDHGVQGSTELIVTRDPYRRDDPKREEH